jgi:hypothetical protein
VVYHARKLHVVILSADLDVMGHIHPEGAPCMPSRLACRLHLAKGEAAWCHRTITRCTAMQKLRIVALGFGTGRQKMVLDDGRIPNPSVVRVAPGTRYYRVEGNRRASRTGLVSDLPPEIPKVTIRNFCITVRWDGRRADFSSAATREVGRYAVHFVFPKPGRYVIAIDFVVPENNNLNTQANATDVQSNVFVSKYLQLQVTSHAGIQEQPSRRPAALRMVSTVPP